MFTRVFIDIMAGVCERKRNAEHFMNKFSYLLNILGGKRIEMVMIRFAFEG